uniref:Uncharacterized protein n=1 Tax=Romanomermis culicivorax TaxID=13658 RepID=A0A915I5V3_ROMCU
MNVTQMMNALFAEHMVLTHFHGQKTGSARSAFFGDNGEERSTFWNRKRRVWLFVLFAFLEESDVLNFEECFSKKFETPCILLILSFKTVSFELTCSMTHRDYIGIY